MKIQVQSGILAGVGNGILVPENRSDKKVLSKIYGSKKSIVTIDDKTSLIDGTNGLAVEIKIIIKPNYL